MSFRTVAEHVSLLYLIVGEGTDKPFLGNL